MRREVLRGSLIGVSAFAVLAAMQSCHSDSGPGGGGILFGSGAGGEYVGPDQAPDQYSIIENRYISNQLIPALTPTSLFVSTHPLAAGEGRACGDYVFVKPASGAAGAGYIYRKVEGTYDGTQFCNDSIASQACATNTSTNIDYGTNGTGNGPSGILASCTAPFLWSGSVLESIVTCPVAVFATTWTTCSGVKFPGVVDAGPPPTLTKLSVRESVLHGGANVVATGTAFTGTSVVRFISGGSHIDVTPTGSTATQVTFTVPDVSGVFPNGAHADIEFFSASGNVTSTAASGGGFLLEPDAYTGAIFIDLYTLRSAGTAGGASLSLIPDLSNTGSAGCTQATSANDPTFVTTVSSLNGQAGVAVSQTGPTWAQCLLGTTVTSTSAESFAISDIPTGTFNNYETIQSLGLASQTTDSTTFTGLYTGLCPITTQYANFISGSQVGSSTLPGLGSVDVAGVFVTRVDPAGPSAYADFNATGSPNGWTATTMHYDRWTFGYSAGISGAYDAARQMPAMTLAAGGAATRALTTSETTTMDNWTFNTFGKHYR